MTVEELMLILQDCNPESEVVFPDKMASSNYSPVVSVEIRPYAKTSHGLVRIAVILDKKILT